MKRRIVFATGNENKMKEIRMILSDLNTEIVSMKEAGVDIDIVEDGISNSQRFRRSKKDVPHKRYVFLFYMSISSFSITAFGLV